MTPAHQLPRDAQRRQWLALWLARIALAGVFLAAAVPKLLAPEVFAADVQNYRLLPDAVVGPFALLVPSCELVVALMLLWTRYQRGAALLGALLLCGFTLAMAQSHLRGIDLRCGCFGAALDAKVSWWTVARSAGLSLSSLGVCWAGGRIAPPGGDDQTQARAHPAVHS